MPEVSVHTLTPAQIAYVVIDGLFFSGPPEPSYYEPILTSRSEACLMIETLSQRFEAMALIDLLFALRRRGCRG